MIMRQLARLIAFTTVGVMLAVPVAAQPSPTPSAQPDMKAAPVEIRPNVWQWTPPEERSEGSTITTTLATFTTSQRGQAYQLPRFAIAGEQSWPDALLAANTGHTLLLNESNALEPAVHQLLANAIRAHRAAGVNDPPILYVIGGEQAVSPAVVEQVRQLGYEVIRLGGLSRVETSTANVLSRWWPTWGQLTVVRAGERDGEDPTAAFADTITALQQAPAYGIVLTPSDRLHPSLHTLLADPGRGSFLADKDTRIDVWGGEQAISEKTFKDLGTIKRQTYYLSGHEWFDGPVERYKINRVAGDSRYATNIAYQKLRVARIQAEQQAKVTATPIVVIDGAGPYAWQLGYGVQSYAKDKAIVLAHDDGLTNEAAAFIRTYGRPSLEHPVACFAKPAICEQVFSLLPQSAPTTETK